MTQNSTGLEQQTMSRYFINILRFPLSVQRYWELWWSFVKRELRARYDGSILGRFWPVLQPLALFTIYYLVFAKLLKIPVSIDIAPWGDPANLAATMETAAAGWRATFFLITGILPWVLIAESWNKCTTVVLENANLIKKIAFPSEFLPFYVVVLNHIYFFIGYGVFLIIAWAVNGSLPALLMWVPVLILLQAVFILGLGMLTGALNIFVRDMSQIVPLVTMFWMFTSPVFYEPRVLAMLGNPTQKKFIEAILPYLYINPVYNLLTIYRDIFKYGRETTLEMGPNNTVLSYNVQENAGISYNCLAIFAVQAVITFIIGYGFFLRSKGRFADEV
ncbi:MAG: ABC transporter permease [Planctomycetota bacterium]